METRELVADALGRAHGIVRASVEGLSPEQLDAQPAPGANPIAWLAWHIARVEDHHVSDLAGRDQAWLNEGWHEAFGLPADALDVGTRHTEDQRDEHRVPNATLLLDYDEVVWKRTAEYLESVSAEDLDRVLDEPQYDPLPTVGVRLASIVNHAALHAGQIDYIRGLIK